VGDRYTVDWHDCLISREGHGNLSYWVTFGPLALGESPRGHVVLYHGAFFKLVPDRVCLVWVGCLEKLLEVMGRLPCLALEVMPGSSNVLLVGVVDVLVVVSLITLVVTATHWLRIFSPTSCCLRCSSSHLCQLPWAMSLECRRGPPSHRPR
jgi:hypothetical protein